MKLNMKKLNIIIISIISLITTFLFADIFSIYDFGSSLTILTTLYLISIYAIIDYLSISLIYIINKKINKEKISLTKLLGLILLFIALLLILLFIIVINIDYLNWYAYSTPFYINVIIKFIRYLLPSTLLIITSIKLIKKS